MSRDYFGTFEGVKYDDLQAAGDGISTFTRNIEVGSDTVVERGMLMAASTPTGVYSLAGASDTGKFFAIARENFEADSNCSITQAFTMGRFHAPKVMTTGGSDTSVLAALEPELRRQSLYLVGLQEFFGRYDAFSG